MTERLRRILHLGLGAQGVAGACALLLAGSAIAQEAGPALQSAPPAPVGASPNQPGFMDAFGRWVEQGAKNLKSNLEDAQSRLEKLGSDASAATKDAAGAVVGLPNARMLTAHEPCTPAQNGAADCQTAAAAFCRGKGFQTGKSLDTQSEQKCTSGRFLIEGRAPTNAECPTRTFVTRAMCQ
ncbi:MAG TPA: hypothetical protein VH678_09995 [Xanthobacteraceae bacterium]|jgi:hypothetical protein